MSTSKLSNPIMLSFKEQHYQCPNCIKVSKQVVMEQMGIRSTPTRIQRIGIFTQDRASKERYQPLTFSLESVEVKSQFHRRSHQTGENFG